MNRLKLLLAAALAGLLACDGGTTPLPVGQIEGWVVIEGEGVDGISVTLSSGAATATSAGGHFSFMEVEGGTHTITISGYPEDASFDLTTAEVTIAQDDQTVNQNFSGSWIRTATLMGMVSVEGTGIAGITVTISGRQDAQMLTDDNGQYTFAALRAGNYTIEISGFDPTDVAFSNASGTAGVAVGSTRVVSFEGVYVRESTVAGHVSVEGSGLSGVTVSLQGMGADEEQMTDAGGQYTFSNLRAGEYQLAISGYDTDEYGFSTTSATVRVEHGRTANVPFEGIMLRTASIMGQVSIEGEGLGGVTVSLSGEGESQTAMTNEAGQYAFTELPAGNFQVAISGYDTDDYSFETTAKNIALALGETATVPFEGILLRTSGISGRVSVEGTGLDSVVVTLSGGNLEDDVTTMTDATGQYAIAGLAEGHYTVAISGYDAEAYNFAMTSIDVELGDDDTQIVNFMGMHARTAVISGMVYVDEAGKNDAYDEGENALAAPGIALALVGPGILDRTIGATDAEGNFAFAELRAGPYQLVVANAAAAGPDYAYGGPAEGYGFALGVGAIETQNVPFDITHQTVTFSVNLKHGANMGAALPGATVSFFPDMAGERKIGDVETDADGMAAMRFARDGTTGNTVYASVAAPSGTYHTSGAMQAVMWNPQYPAAPASNDADIVNTMASFTFSGATVMTAMGGGMALGGWAVEVTSGDEAVDGAPDELGADGSASFSESMAAGDLPKTYMIAMADDQANDSTGDGGENYISTMLSHTHDGLSLAGTSTDIGTMEVTYTTQTLKAYVHQENDQVMGYTGNVLGGDQRMGGIIDIELRYIDDSGRSRAFSRAQGDTIQSSAEGGAYTFRNVPAMRNVIVTADEFATLGNNADGKPIANTNKLLDGNGHSDEIAAYADAETNGIMGGAFGADGGFHHTVELCPLMSREEDQRHGECGTFAFVETYAVDGQAWKNRVYMSGDDWTRDAEGNVFVGPYGHAGLTVSLDPVAGENLAMDDGSFTEEGNTKGFDFGHMASGVYEVAVPSGWIAQRGPVDSPTNDLEDRLSPLDSALNIDVSPLTGYVYGRVTDGENRPLPGVTVNANGKTAETDQHGRYVVEGFYASSYRAPGSQVTQRNRILVTTAHEGSQETLANIRFVRNSPQMVNITIRDATEVTVINGTVTHSNGGAGVGGVRVWIDGAAPLNPNARSSATVTQNDIYVTDSDGTYSVRIAATEGGASATVTVSQTGMFFTPDQHTVSAVAGANFSGIDFTAFDNGTIHGRVVDADNNPISGAIVTASLAGGNASLAAETASLVAGNASLVDGSVVDADTTGTTGTYTLSVRHGQYDVTATKHGYTISSVSGINVPNDGKAIDDIVATPAEDNADLVSLDLSGVTFEDATGQTVTFSPSTTSYAATVGYSISMTTVSATPAVPGARVTDIHPADADADATGHQVELEAGTTTIEVEVTAMDGTTRRTYVVEVTQSITITGTVTDAVTGEGVAGVLVLIGARLLNGSGPGGRYATTDSNGTYSAEIVSSRSSVAVTPWPRPIQMTFTPDRRFVTVAGGGKIAGVDFTGYESATITGRVLANGAPVSGVNVRAWPQPRDRFPLARGEAETDRRGIFTITHVPTHTGIAVVGFGQWGYQFDSLTVSVGPGETKSIGDIEAMPTVSPINVVGTRDTASDGSYNNNFTVTWSPGPGGHATQYQVGVYDPAVGGRAQDVGSPVTDTTADGSYRIQITGAPETWFWFQVLAYHDHDGDPTTGLVVAEPRYITFADPIDPVVSGVEARRVIDSEPDSLVVSWSARGNNNSRWRVVVSFDGGTTWYVAQGTATGGTWGDTVSNLERSMEAVATGGTAKTPTAAELNGALMFRVDYRQGETDGNGNPIPWMAGGTASVPAKS